MRKSGNSFFKNQLPISCISIKGAYNLWIKHTCKVEKMLSKRYSSGFLASTRVGTSSTSHPTSFLTSSIPSCKSTEEAPVKSASLMLPVKWGLRPELHSNRCRILLLLTSQLRSRSLSFWLAKLSKKQLVISLPTGAA